MKQHIMDVVHHSVIFFRGSNMREGMHSPVCSRFAAIGMKAVSAIALLVALPDVALAVDSILYSFKGGTDGSGPEAGLILDTSSGALFGTTQYGGTAVSGTANGGTVFQLAPPVPPATVWKKTTLYSFGNAPDGKNPVSGVIFDSAGALYGTTTNGGAYTSYGTAFKLTPPVPPATKWTRTTLYSFRGSFDGANPQSELLFDSNGALVGTAYYGGQNGVGTVFKLTPPCGGLPDWIFTVLYDFKGGADGSNPKARLIADASGALYGTTEYGGTAPAQAGTVFKLKPPVPPATSWTKTTLYSFKGGTTDGGNPQAGLLRDATGKLYGTTYSGGTAGQGTVFMLTPPAPPSTVWTRTILYKFNGTKGAYPVSELVADGSGALYGTTEGGGTGGAGVVYKLTPPVPPATAWTQTVLHNFTGSPDGSTPHSAVIFDGGGALYATTVGGGASSAGTIFRIP